MNEELVGNLASRIAEEYELPNEVRRTSDLSLQSNLTEAFSGCSRFVNTGLIGATDDTITVSSNDNIYNQDGFYPSNGYVLGSGGGGVEDPNTTESLSEKIDRLEEKIDKLTTMVDLRLDSKTLDLLDDLTL